MQVFPEIGFGDFLPFAQKNTASPCATHLGVYRLSPAMVLDRLDYVALAAFIVVVCILGVLFRDGAEGDSAAVPHKKTARPCET